MDSLDKRPKLKKTHMRFGTWNVKDVREIGWSGMDWIDLAHDREQRRDLVNTVMNLRVA
jgi:hypothetical protein